MLNFGIFLITLMLLEKTVIQYLYNSNSAADTSNQDEYIVEISNGKIRGRKDITAGLKRPYYAYQGIPYAQPPVGKLRFEPPVPHRNWRGILNTTEYKSDCIKLRDYQSSTQSEDCLQINVYKPDVRQQKLAVIVLVPGGFYGATSNSTYFGPDYLLDNNVIVVTFNYRLGFFGFFSTGDLVIPGNNGLKDQALALKWVKKNIAKFGGNSNKITLYGISAGAASVGYHLTSTVSKGLYNNVILESGSSLCLWGLSRHMAEAVGLIAESLNLTTHNSRDFVKALKKLDTKTLTSVAVSAKDSLEGPSTEGLVFVPVIEPLHSGAIVTGNSHQLLTEGKFERVPILLGMTSMESLLTFDTIQAYYQNSSIERLDIVPIDLKLVDKAEIDLVYNKVKNFYFGSEEIYNQTFQVFQFASDNLYNRAIIETNRLLSKHARTYFYEFSYTGNLTSITMPEYPIPGVPHTAEMYYIWSLRNAATPTVTDNLVRNRLTKLWTNFAKYDNPTPQQDDLFDNVIWHSSDLIKDNLLYLQINSDLELGLNPKNKYVKFWNKLYKEYGNAPFDTY